MKALRPDLAAEGISMSETHCWRHGRWIVGRECPVCAAIPPKQRPGTDALDYRLPGSFGPDARRARMDWEGAAQRGKRKRSGTPKGPKDAEAGQG